MEREEKKQLEADRRIREWAQVHVNSEVTI
jgi:hypothetical protein